MAEFESPTYVIDFKDEKTLNRIRNVQPDQIISIMVSGVDPQAPSIPAKGELRDGVFHVSVTTSAGEQTHKWTYEFLMDAVRVYSRD
jgi:hypothetical protein